MMGRVLGLSMIMVGMLGLGMSLVDWSTLKSPWRSKSGKSAIIALQDAPTDEKNQESLSPGAPPEAAGDGQPAPERSIVRDVEAQTPNDQIGTTTVTQKETASVRVIDRDPSAISTPKLWVDISTGRDEVSEDSGYANFVVTLSEPAPQPIVLIFTTIDGSARDGEDYRAQRGTVTFEPGIGSAEIRTLLIDDQVQENDEQFAIVLNGSPNIVNLRHRRATVTIKDND